ncbi:MAG TPA: thiamine pyrophosphate-dependent enzyme [Streptosporangiaceae bacterium]|nr:thiamine pyrophosphate-dependent enzyme [Streptosporangiaceae bacterium]
MFGANGIVAAGLPIAVGAAAAIRLRKGSEVVVAFFGDGAVAQGAFHEAVNLAALWRLPVLFFCENNGYAEFSPTADHHPVPLAQRAAGYGLGFDQVDGNDVVAVAAVTAAACDALRQGQRPRIIEAMTYRWHGHYEGDPQRYRLDDEIASWRKRDPILLHDALARELGSDERVFLAGVDVGTGGNVFGITRGLHSRWPDRVLDTPISESAIVGLAVGAAMSGLRPVVELMLPNDRGCPAAPRSPRRYARSPAPERLSRGRAGSPRPA